MLSALKRYQSRLTEALERYFPRTTAYLRSGTEAPGSAYTPAPRSGCVPPPQREPAFSTDTGIYGPGPLPVNEARIQAMRERVGEAVAAGLIAAPSDEQWAMILGHHPLTRILAGAGSGKSTTLVLRVVFMLCHLDIRPEHLTVISFTNASCAQLRRRLVEMLRFWRYPLNDAQARQCVRTFHSAMGLLARDLLDNPRWFEQLATGETATEPDTAFASTRLHPLQVCLLRKTYQRCYAEQPAFRDQVHELLRLPPSRPGEKFKAPEKRFRLPGEFASLPLFEAFHVQADFMESIGIRPDRIRPGDLPCSGRERTFVEALAKFWNIFRDELQEQGLLTFNGAFQTLTDRLMAGAKGIPTASLAPFTHLLIDEFQDISPQIVLWLRALHRVLAQRGETVSLMAIGDDCQSIYGWRGSSPELFENFDRYFPTRGRGKRSALLRLETNYRCAEPLIRDAESVLAGVASKQAKTCRPGRPSQPGEHGVRLVFGAGLPELLAEIRDQCAHASGRRPIEPNALLLLSRRNEPLKKIRARLDPGLPVTACTIHRAKGLQAEVAIILDDCPSPASHPLRNALYAYSGFFRTNYDQSMRDENLRLAYVAITRGVSRVIWFARQPRGATRLLAQQAAHHASTYLPPSP